MSELKFEFTLVWDSSNIGFDIHGRATLENGDRVTSYSQLPICNDRKELRVFWRELKQKIEMGVKEKYGDKFEVTFPEI